jgi:Diacylglycerol kinase accessory domain
VSGVGCDAKVAYEFHTMREERPEMFYNQVLVPYISHHWLVTVTLFQGSILFPIFFNL